MGTLPSGIAVGSTQSHMPLRQDRVGICGWMDLASYWICGWMDTLPDGIAVGSTQSHMSLRQDRVGSVQDWKDWVGSVEDWKHPRWERSRTKALPHFVIVGSRGIYGRMGTLPKGIAVGSTQSHVPLRWDRVGSVTDLKDWQSFAWDRSGLKAGPHFLTVGSDWDLREDSHCPT